MYKELLQTIQRLQEPKMCKEELQTLILTQELIALREGHQAQILVQESIGLKEVLQLQLQSTQDQNVFNIEKHQTVHQLLEMSELKDLLGTITQQLQETKEFKEHRRTVQQL